eukprot:scaffold3506_cov63-Phaeocystis_antarctica.AAC.1
MSREAIVYSPFRFTGFQVQPSAVTLFTAQFPVFVVRGWTFASVYRTNLLFGRYTTTGQCNLHAHVVCCTPGRDRFVLSLHTQRSAMRAKREAGRDAARAPVRARGSPADVSGVPIEQDGQPRAALRSGGCR